MSSLGTTSPPRWPAAGACVLACLGLTAGCNQGGTNIQQPVFERPGTVDFACFDLDLVTPLPLERCSRTNGSDDEGDARLHALVTQTSPGEVASVDIRIDNDGRVLDLDRRIPGFTHLRVGAQPSGVLVPTRAPETTIVASFGSRELLATATRRFRPEAAAAGQPVAREVDRLVLPSPPTDVVLREPETGLPELFASLPGTSRLLRVPLVEVEGADGIVRLGFGEPSDLVLADTGEAPVTADPDDLPDYCTAAIAPCEAIDPIPAVPARAPVSLGDAPSPRGLTIDDAGRLYVADGSLPLVHTFDLSSAAPTDEPIPIAVPTTTVAVTPLVPATVGDTEPTERFLYGIDATDGSVLAVDLGSGALVPISNDPIAVADRLDTPASARVLEVLTPDYDAADLSFCDPASTDDLDELAPRRARGVFLAVGTTDGDVRFFDVFDLDTPCRGIDDDDVFFAIRRHRPRSGEFEDDPVELSDDPLVREVDRATRVGDDGVPRSGNALRFVPFPDGCPGATQQVFPDPRADPPLDPVFCARRDPFVTGGENWELSWESTVPSTEGGRGILPPSDGSGTVLFQAPTPPDPGGGAGDPEIPFCERGVLGSANVTGLDEDEPLAGYLGDVLVVVGPLPSRTERDPTCRARFRIPDDESDFDDQIYEIAFPIVEAFDDRLIVEDTTRDDGPVDDEPARVFTLDEVQECFPNPVRYRVEVRRAFRVFGSRTRFPHPVFAGPGGRCEVATDRPLDRGRAFAGPAEDGGLLYDNGQLLFRLAQARTLESDETLIVDLTVSGYAPKMRYELGTIGVASDLRWLPEARLFYVVDQSGEQLVELDLADQSRALRGGELFPASNRVFR